MSHAHLKETDLQNAARRLRKEGCTRFHLAVRGDKSVELMEWARSGVAPLMRRNREGNYPFCDFLTRLGSHQHEHTKPIDAMPDWWTKYPDWGGQQGWIERQKKIRAEQQQADQMLSKLFLEGIDWTKASDDFKAAIRQALPSSLDLKKGAGKLIDAAMRAGLVLAPFQHQGITMTMAMWSVIRPIRDSNVMFWLEREQVDPPGNGPGFLSLAVACWNGCYRHPAESERWIRKAIKLGADAHRPAVKAREKERLSFDEMILGPAEDHEKTVLGQAQQSRDPVLLQALGALPQTRQEQLETYHAMVRVMVDEAEKWHGDPAKDERIDGLLMVLAQGMPDGFAEDPHLTAVETRKILLLEIGPLLPLSHFQRFGALLEATLSSFKDPHVSPGHYRIAAVRAISQLGPEDLVSWMGLVERHIGPRHSPSETVAVLFDLLTGYIDQSPAGNQVDRIFHAIDHFHGGQPIGENSLIDDAIFKKGISSLTLLEVVLARLDSLGYQPGEQSWRNLAARLAPQDGQDGRGYPAENKTELKALISYLRRKGTQASSDAFEIISTPLRVDGPARNGAYCRWGRWDAEQIWQARWMAFEAMLANHGNLDRRDGKPLRSPMEAVLASAVLAWKENDDGGQQGLMLKHLVDAGAHVDIEQVRDLEESHPYWMMAAYYQNRQMDSKTAPGSGRARTPRL